MNTNQTVHLACQEGKSDKVYDLSLVQKNGGWVVNFAYGRRGSTLRPGTKTATPLPHESALKVYEKTLAEKLGEVPPYHVVKNGEEAKAPNGEVKAQAEKKSKPKPKPEKKAPAAKKTVKPKPKKAPKKTHANARSSKPRWSPATSAYVWPCELCRKAIPKETVFYLRADGQVAHHKGCHQGAHKPAKRVAKPAAKHAKAAQRKRTGR